MKNGGKSHQSENFNGYLTANQVKRSIENQKAQSKNKKQNPKYATYTQKDTPLPSPDNLKLKETNIRNLETEYLKTTFLMRAIQKLSSN